MSSPVFSAKRSEASLGISGFLAENGSVFYTQLFSGSHIGKVSDLLVARLRNEGLEEVSLRLIIVLGMFEASEFARSKDNPVSFECGFDHEKMVMGFSFLGDHSTKKINTQERDLFMAHLERFSDEIIIRHHENKNRTELIAIVSKSAGAHLREHVAKVSETSFQAQPPQDVKVKTYVELGDLDFDKLLADRASPAQEGPRFGQLDAEVGGKTQQDGTVRRFKADSEGGVNSETVKGKGSVVKKLLQKVFGAKKPDEGQREKVFRQDPVVHKDSQAKFTSNHDDLKPEVVQIFSQDAPEKGSEPETKGVKEEAPKEEDVVVESESTLQDAFKKIATTAAEVKEELKSERTKGYVDTLSAELIAEKSRISELSKKISITVRQKELEFKNKEQAFETELRKKEEILKQREIAASRLKEQLSKVSADLDEARNSGRSSEDEARDRTKLQQSQRLLTVTKQENADLAKKVDDLKDQMMQLQQAKAGSKASSEELWVLKDKADRAVKQVEEMKKTNQQLLEKLSDKNFERTSNQSSTEDLKRKLEAAQKAATNTKKDFDKVSHQFEEMRREDLRMKMELGKLREELKRAKSAANRSGGGSPPPPSSTGAAGGSNSDAA